MRRVKQSKSYRDYNKSLSTQLKEVSSNLEKAINSLTEAAKDSIDGIAKEIRDESLKIVPVDTGDLKDSIYTEVEDSPEKYTVEIGYKDKKAPYAHENSDRRAAYKNPTTPNTHYQFLLTPATEIENEMSDRVAKALKEVLK